MEKITKARKQLPMIKTGNYLYTIFCLVLMLACNGNINKINQDSLRKKTSNDVEDTSRTFFCGVDSVLQNIKGKIALEKISLKDCQYLKDKIVLTIDNKNDTIENGLERWFSIANIDSIKTYKIQRSQINYLIFSTTILAATGSASSKILFVVYDLINKKSYYLENFFYRSSDCFFIAKEHNNEILNAVSFTYGDEYNLSGKASLDVTEHALKNNGDFVTKNFTTTCLCNY